METQGQIAQERSFRFDPSVMSRLRAKYNKDKKTFVALRSVYLAICEMERDFGNQPIEAFNETVGICAGLSRHIVGKYITILEQEGFIQKIPIVDPVTHLKSKGTYLRVLNSQNSEEIPTASEEGRGREVTDIAI